uniref:Uncharacterized protein n=1 Tax=Molossus molossus TaxID=27622 RepID=A0A7J8C970_MOLMO|nr:hypothetical protein HJG59_009981 [Molossus molossus]
MRGTTYTQFSVSGCIRFTISLQDLGNSVHLRVCGNVLCARGFEGRERTLGQHCARPLMASAPRCCHVESATNPRTVSLWTAPPSLPDAVAGPRQSGCRRQSRSRVQPRAGRARRGPCAGRRPKPREPESPAMVNAK